MPIRVAVTGAYIKHCIQNLLFCGWQGFGVFMFTWQFFIPLIIFIFSYWKILGVLRGQSKVFGGRPRTIAIEPIPGTSGSSVLPVVDESITVEKQGKEIVPKAKSQAGAKAKDQTAMKSAQLNVVKTMIYITVCYTLCWMPMYVYYLLMTVQVCQLNSKVTCYIV